MDITQIVTIVSLILITGIVVASGIWLILVLKQLRTTLSKTNQILEDTQLITSSVAKPVSSFSEFLMGFKNGFGFFNNLFNRKNKTDDSSV
jgi:Na+-transporting NADH:ubiquinone oxidoreductase subunit NqrC